MRLNSSSEGRSSAVDCFALAATPFWGGGGGAVFSCTPCSKPARDYFCFASVSGPGNRDWIPSDPLPAVSACFISNKTVAVRLLVNSPGGQIGNAGRGLIYGYVRPRFEPICGQIFFCNLFLCFLFLIKKSNRLQFSCILTCILLLLLLIQCKISLY